MKRRCLPLLGAVAVLAACSEGTGPAGNVTRVSLSFSTAAGTQPSLSVVAADTMTDGQNELVLSSIEVVLREIELKRVEVVECDVEPEPVGCEAFETGPTLVALPLNGATAHAMTIDIEPGSYDEIEFDIHKVSSGDPEDAAFRSAHPDLVDTSVRVQGSYNGDPFTFVTDLMDAQKYDLVPALVVVEGTTTANVTLHLDVSSWFEDAAGALVDPASANKSQPHENLVKDNIRRSIDAFEDSDRDGQR